MKELTSINNDTVKLISSLSQKKYRDESSLFISEGLKSFQEGLKNNCKIKYVFILEGYKISQKFDEDLIYVVNEKVMKKMATTDSIPPILTVFEKFDYTINDFKNLSKIVLLENIKDNGNLGTIIRSSAAFDVDGIILFGDCCDLYSPKTIRSSVGTFFQLPVVQCSDIQLIRKVLSDFHFISTDLHRKSDISLKEIKDKFVLMFGSEADGLSTELSIIAQNNTILPIKSSVESLNLATALSIILYQISMQ